MNVLKNLIMIIMSLNCWMSDYYKKMRVYDKGMLRIFLFEFWEYVICRLVFKLGVYNGFL